MRVAIIGASGFVGSALCERLFFLGDTDFIPFVRSSANAWRIARLPVEIRWLDLRERAQVFEVLSTCDTVVNCALDTSDSRSQGLRNLVDAARQSGIRRFVHLSSIAIYGQDPAPDSASESGQLNPGDNAYGRLKLNEDEIALSLHRSGVSTVILCPGNIGGPYSPFMRGLASRMLLGPLPLVDGGCYPSNIVHVDNLVEAILAVVRSDAGSGQRYFVNELRPVPWRELVDDLSQLLSIDVELIEIGREQVLQLLTTRTPSSGPEAHLRAIASPELRLALSKLPVFHFLNSAASRVFSRLPDRYQAMIREKLTWPVAVEKTPQSLPLDDRYVTVQVRRVFHAPNELLRTFGWHPPLVYKAGIETTAAWLRFCGLGSSSPT